MLHPFLAIRRKDTAASMPPWAGVGLHLGGLLASGWLMVVTLSHRAWVAGLVGGVIFVTALFVALAYLFPDNRR
jgi:uncharacterized membrane protein YgdD (TMEM256/DUF423 family)